MGMGQVRPVLLERPLRIVGWSWGRLRFGLVQRACSGPADWVWVRRRRGGGQGEEGGEAAARSEPMLAPACFHAADGCDAPIGLAAFSKSSEEAVGWDALEEICVS